MNGATLCGMGKDRFLDLAPDFVGDILWEHLEMLQKGEVPSVRDSALTHGSVWWWEGRGGEGRVEVGWSGGGSHN